MTCNVAPEFRGQRHGQFVHSERGRAFRFGPLALVAAALAAFCLSNGPAAAEAARLEPVSNIEAIPFALDDLSGRRRELGEFRGTVVLLHFFATWCAPCVGEISSLKRLHEQAGDSPLTILAVDVGEVDLRVRKFFSELPVGFPVLLDRDRKIAKAWNVTGLPSTYVLDADHTPRLFVEGDLDWSRPEVRTQIESLYPARPPARAGG